MFPPEPVPASFVVVLLLHPKEIAANDSANTGTISDLDSIERLPSVGWTTPLPNDAGNIASCARADSGK
jgi:hypothetical protein